MMLEIEQIDTFYGLSHVLFGLSLNVSKGQVVCLLGRNGAGKSTTMKSIIGLTPPKNGTIRFNGENICGKRPYWLCRLGIGYVPDNRRVFADLSVDENLEIAERCIEENDVWHRASVYDLFPALRNLRTRKAGVLSGGEQQMLTIGRTLVTNPALILLDEPMEGLAPMIVTEIEDRVEKLKATGISILLAEQNMASALKLSDFGYVIDNGRIKYQGTAKDLNDNEEVQRKHLLL